MSAICRTNATSSYTSVTAKNSSIRMLQADTIAQDVMMDLVRSVSVPAVSFLTNQSIVRSKHTSKSRVMLLNHKRRKQRRQHFHSWIGLKALPRSPGGIVLTNFLRRMQEDILVCQTMKCPRLPQIKHMPQLHPSSPTIKCQCYPKGTSANRLAYFRGRWEVPR